MVLIGLVLLGYWLVSVAGAPLGDGANAHECLTACLPVAAALVGAVEALEVVALGAGFASHHSAYAGSHRTVAGVWMLLLENVYS